MPHEETTVLTLIEVLPFEAFKDVVLYILGSTFEDEFAKLFPAFGDVLLQDLHLEHLVLLETLQHTVVTADGLVPVHVLLTVAHLQDEP